MVSGRQRRRVPASGDWLVSVCDASVRSAAASRARILSTRLTSAFPFARLERRAHVGDQLPVPLLEVRQRRVLVGHLLGEPGVGGAHLVGLLRGGDGLAPGVLLVRLELAGPRAVLVRHPHRLVGPGGLLVDQLLGVERDHRQRHHREPGRHPGQDQRRALPRKGLRRLLGLEPGFRKLEVVAHRGTLDLRVWHGNGQPVAERAPFCNNPVAPTADDPDVPRHQGVPRRPAGAGRREPDGGER